MKERPILFSAPMVRAILAGSKTQTRRALAPDLFMSSGGAVVRMASAGPATTGIREAHCPYWREPGDRLWVRETWLPDPPIDDSWASTQWSGCGRRISEVPERFQHPRFCCYAADWLHGQVVWRPSIHMPRWASRITLEVTGVRVERLQDISEADAIAEGCTAKQAEQAPAVDQSRQDYRDLWESINGPGSWDANPWCWVIEFRRVS